MNKALIVILATIALDAIGGGLIIPILPDLLKEVAGSGDIGWLFGLLIVAYSGMQFLFAPALGAISDRYGRRPVLLISLAGAMIDYLFMAFSPWGWALVIGRTIAGLSSGSMSVATAYITDITAPEDRAKRFGTMGAVMGIGFILGPVLGGTLAVEWLRMPFLVAALLNGLNLLLALFVLPETRRVREDGPQSRLSLEDLNPLRALIWLGSLKQLVPLVVVFTVFSMIAMIPGTLWSIYGIDRFGWEPLQVGISISGFGIGMALTQAFATGWFTRQFGDYGTILLGVVFDAIGFVFMGLATEGWMTFALIPFFALGGIIMPAVQSLATRGVSDDEQGRLQGVLASIGSVAAVVGPLICTAVYFSTRASLPGLVWFGGAALYVIALTIATVGRRRIEPAAA